MKKLRLIGVHSQKEELLRELMLLGCVEVSDPAGRPDREELAAFRRPDGGKVWQKRSEQTTIVNALRLLDKHAPAKKGLLTPKPEVECAKLLDESALAADLALAGEILSLDAEARSLLTRASRERASAEAMTPWTALNVPLERMETQSCEMQLGTLPAAVPMEEVTPRSRSWRSALISFPRTKPAGMYRCSSAGRIAKRSPRRCGRSAFRPFRCRRAPERRSRSITTRSAAARS